ncbi:LINE-1 retrotransposable element ORF2 protein [Folsomia candida]|uniref:LINE-1 retrotransposable element ORF2 protein n=1 Tax=Folsomia candida TaxID=158441 RepID=A0A226ENF3_FOLCA|nr:LINE-1 retrotransposable element ORF2 protein [Folsomia candida]
MLRPIFKKGDPQLPSNYRPIALASTILKIFTTILSNRLQTWAEKYGHFSPFQAGFRKNMETLEQIFCLLTLIQSKLRHPRGKLFAIFIDARMAFDSCLHDRMWKVLSERGVSSKYLKVLTSLYRKASGQILTPNGLTTSFRFQKGVLQGEPQSSCLFNFFIDGLARRLKKSGISPVKIGSTDFHILMFADDVVIVANSADSLQGKINVAATFFKDRGLQCSISKTKIVIFAKRRSSDLPPFKWNDDTVDIVDSYTYLGVTMHRNGTFNRAHKEFKEKATAAVMKVLNITRRSGVPPLSTQFKLFNSIARATLLYGSSIWAMKFVDDIDKLQIRFLKKLLRLLPSTPDYFVRLETGARDTRLQHLADTLGFWERISRKKEDSPVRQCMIIQMKWTRLNSTPMQRNHCWGQDFLDLLKIAKCENLPSTLTSLVTMRKTLLINYELHIKNQDVSRMQNSSFIPHYKFIKLKSTTEGYFNMNHSIQKCSLMTQLRLNKFSIKIGESYIPLNSNCPLCSDTCSVEHLMFSCTSLRSERQSLIFPLIPNFNPTEFTNMQLYIALFSSAYSDRVLNNLFLFWHKVAKYFDLCSDQ